MTRLRLVGTLVAAALTLVLAGIFTAAAEAAKPDRAPAEAGGPFSFEPGVVCPFAVYAEAEENRQIETVFSSGKVTYTGFFATRLAANGNELSLVTPGPVRITEEAGLLKVTSSGPLLYFFFPGDVGPGEVSSGRTYLFNGRTETLIDPDTFAFVSFDYSGRATDVCALLA